MLPDAFWKLELAEAIGKKRGLLLKFALPFLLIIPLVLPTIPLPIRAGGFTLALAFVGVFGSAVGLSRLREGRLTSRLALLPIPPWRLVTGYILLNSAMDGVQFIVPLLVFVAFSPVSVSALILIAICFASVLVAANCIGTLVAVAARSSGEGHLIAILVMLLIAGVSGLFSQTPASGGVSPGMVLPFRHLADVLQIGLGAYSPDILVLLAPLSAMILLILGSAAAPYLIRGG